MTIGGPSGAASRLAAVTGADEVSAASIIRTGLLAGCSVVDPEPQRPVFAFKLHQFVTRGDTAYAALGPAASRHITMQAQALDPTDPDRPASCCRSCSAASAGPSTTPCPD